MRPEGECRGEESFEPYIALSRVAVQPEPAVAQAYAATRSAPSNAPASRRRAPGPDNPKKLGLLRAAEHGITVAGVLKGKPGTYTITPADGSPTIVKVKETRGDGRQGRDREDAPRRPGQRVIHLGLRRRVGDGVGGLGERDLLAAAAGRAADRAGLRGHAR